MDLTRISSAVADDNERCCELQRGSRHLENFTPVSDRLQRLVRSTILLACLAL
jgi:hypothetical protein